MQALIKVSTNERNASEALHTQINNEANIDYLLFLSD